MKTKRIVEFQVSNALNLSKKLNIKLVRSSGSGTLDLQIGKDDYYVSESEVIEILNELGLGCDMLYEGENIDKTCNDCNGKLKMIKNENCFRCESCGKDWQLYKPVEFIQ